MRNKYPSTDNVKVVDLEPIEVDGEIFNPPSISLSRQIAIIDFDGSEEVLREIGNLLDEADVEGHTPPFKMVAQCITEASVLFSTKSIHVYGCWKGKLIPRRGHAKRQGALALVITYLGKKVLLYGTWEEFREKCPMGEVALATAN